MGSALQQYNHENQARIWAERISACRSSGKKIRIWCEENNLSINAYYKWQRKLADETLRNRQSEVVFAEAPPITQEIETPAAVIQTSSAEIKVFRGADEETLRNLFRAVGVC